MIECWNERKRMHEELPADGANDREAKRRKEANQEEANKQEREEECVRVK